MCGVLPSSLLIFLYMSFISDSSLVFTCLSSTDKSWMAHTRFFKACFLVECTRMGFLVVEIMMTTIDLDFALVVVRFCTVAIRLTTNPHMAPLFNPCYCRSHHPLDTSTLQTTAAWLEGYCENLLDYTDPSESRHSALVITYKNKNKPIFRKWSPEFINFV